MKVLVTGAGGYIGSRLVPRLLAEGHTVRAAFTRIETSQRMWWADQVECVSMNINDLDQTAAAFEGRECVYYLIHGLGNKDFLHADRAAAKNAATVASASEVRKVVYLSGLVPDEPEYVLSKHLSSRLETERILSDPQNSFASITLRAAIILGAGSVSFEVLRQTCERLLILPFPKWMCSKVQPIAAVDVLEALVGALQVDAGTRHYDVGGSDQLSYPELLFRYCQITGKHRQQITVPTAPTQMVSFLASRLVDVPTGTVESLIESLKHDMICSEDDFVRELLPAHYELTSIEAAVQRSLKQTDDLEPSRRDPQAIMPHDPHWAGREASPTGTAFAVATSLFESLGRKNNG